MAVQFNILSSLGTFHLQDGYATAEFGAAITGVWNELQVGNKYLLTEIGLSGNAVAEILKGNVPNAYRGLVGSPVVDIDTSITGYIKTDYVIEPVIKWIFAPGGTGVWYKVLSVLDDNNIVVEKLYGINPGNLCGAFTRGYALKSVTLNAYGGDITVHAYDSLQTIISGTIVTFPINIDISGPIYAIGTDGTITTNVATYDNQWL